MKNLNRCWRKRTPVVAGTALLFAHLLLATPSAHAASTDLANVPMAVRNTVTPNVLVVLDNSQSMDGMMDGTLVSGHLPYTRGNIGRESMRTAIGTYQTAFRWGLMSFALTGAPTLYSTYAFFLGSTTGMVFTNDCVGYVAGVFNGAPLTPGVSASQGGRNCVANPQPFAGANFITYDVSSDHHTIVDVLYYGGYGGAPAINQAWAPAINTSNPTTYGWYLSHNPTTSWGVPGNFSSFWFNSYLVPTDAGFVPGNYGTTPPNNISRSLYLPRGWGYYTGITGSGTLNEPVKVDSTTHFNTLMTLLGSETNGATGEIKNAAVYTPTTGTLQSAKTYFSSGFGGANSPIEYSCQQNFVMLVTDGLPTGTTTGGIYSPPPNTTNTCDWSTTTHSCTTGSFGQAATDAIAAVTALRTTPNAIASTFKDGSGAVTGKYDVQTYVVALASTLGNNANNMAVMNAMAYAGGGLDRALLATDTATFQNAMVAITDSVTAKIGAAAAVAVSNALVTATDNASFSSKYNSSTWTGELDSFTIDPTTLATGTTSRWGSPAQDQLDLRTESSRKIVTSTDVAGSRGGRQFQPTTATTTTKLSAAQQTLLNTPSMTDGAAVLAYLRGDRSGETTNTYRARAHLLGDIVNAEAVALKAPRYSYGDPGYLDSDTAFKQANASRALTVYQAANDGMLHAFNGDTGAELWAYVPNLVMANLNNLSSKSNFAHRYYVDATPAAGDVDMANIAGAGGSGSWMSMLVGGLGKGGRGYYALNVTSPAAAGEADAAAKVMWEFPNSVNNATSRSAATLNTGYTFGKPIIVKTQAQGWVVLLTSGYNNGTNTGDSGGDGLGHLFVVNPQTGDLIADIKTTGCHATPTTTPCGLAQISAFAALPNQDATVDYVYGGDLMGNVWRFDLTGAAVSDWHVDKFAVLKDASGVTQSITSAPELSSYASGGSQIRMVYVGTGQYLGDTDIPGATGANSHASQTQTIYGLRDSLSGNSSPLLPDPLRSHLVAQTLTTSGSTRSVTNNAVNLNSGKGWYVDLPTTGERIVGDPIVVNGALVFTSNIPSSTTCVPGGSSWLYYLNAKTGGTPDAAVTPTVGIFLGSALASRVVVLRGTSGVDVGKVTRSDGGEFTQSLPGGSASSTVRRVSWRELLDQ